MNNPTPINDKYNCIIKIMDYIRNNYAENCSIVKYAEMCNLDKYYFIKLFHEYTNETPHRFKTKTRIEKAMELLQSTNMNNTEIAEFVGYSSSFYFSRIFKTHTGFSPEAYRKNMQ